VQNEAGLELEPGPSARTSPALLAATLPRSERVRERPSARAWHHRLPVITPVAGCGITFKKKEKGTFPASA